MFRRVRGHGLPSERQGARAPGVAPWLAGCGLCLWPLAVTAQAPPPSTSVPQQPGLLQDDALYAMPTRMDRVGRVLAPVLVNGRGPFRFILDTGANRSVLSPRLAAELQLTPSTDRPIGVHGVTGSAVLPTVEVQSLQAGNLVMARNRRMPVLPETVLADADGILGIEGLSGARIDIDFAGDEVTIGRSKGAAAPRGSLTIPVTIRHGGLLMTRAWVGRQRVMAIIDTGAERTLGNFALRDALRLAPTGSPEGSMTTVIGATPELREGTALLAPTIRIGEAELRGLEVTFAELHVWKVWDLEDEPALLVGMDLLGTVRRLVIDYRRREIQIEPN